MAAHLAGEPRFAAPRFASPREIALPSLPALRRAGPPVSPAAIFAGNHPAMPPLASTQPAMLHPGKVHPGKVPGAGVRRAAAAMPGTRSSGAASSGALGHAADRAGVSRGFGPVAAALKRLVDLVAGLVLLAGAIPVLIPVVLALQLDSPGPVFFVQRRVGRDGRLFGCIKLRTMRRDADSLLAALLATCPRSRREWEADRKLRRDPRVSPLARLVRKLSLDELPQLVNVVSGKMSLVGPRPIVQAEIPRYGAYFADYCAVKPGLTGLWQVSGRNDVSYADRIQFDRHYARHASLLLDFRIALRTVPAVLLAQGSY